MQFNELNLCDPILRAIEVLNFTTPTEIQQEAIPYLLETDRDFVGQAQTGTGKTAAFVVPLLERIKDQKIPTHALILTPTRELAYQVEKEINNFGRYLNLNTCLIYGGTPYDKQINLLRKTQPEIIVGTPGRIIDLIERGKLDFSNSEYLILDEADEMLKMGFIDDVQHIMECFSAARKTWMFSATMPDEIVNLINKNLNKPKFIKCKKKSLSNEDIEQSYYLVDRKYRFEALHRLILQNGSGPSIVFCRTRQDTKDIADKLLAKGIMADCLNGDLSQGQREYAMNKFKSGRTDVLVCTDVAARGIDVTGLEVVYNFGLPLDNESYVHRIGRTGRAGAKGLAQSIVTNNEMGLLRKIEKTINHRIKRSDVPKNTDLKSKIVSQKIEKISKIKESVVSKGNEFKVDSSFGIFLNEFDNCSKDDLQKIFFTLLFNKEFHDVDRFGDVDFSDKKRSDFSARKQRPGRGSSDNRRRSFSQRSHDRKDDSSKGRRPRSRRA
ncbi:MAG: DEAD/DEAH box helicase [Halobacteriovoraceae bacterium]|nr:DEAD/DEAH box helicase [Halobacteriovoraceae bacterium]